MIPFLPFLLIPFIWIPNGTSYEQVQITYDSIDSMKGMYSMGKDGIHHISFNPDFVFTHDPLAGNVWNHEVYHAWGISHAEMLWWSVEGSKR